MRTSGGHLDSRKSRAGAVEETAPPHLLQPRAASRSLTRLPVAR